MIVTPTSSPSSHLAEHSAKDLLRFITCGSVDDGKSTLIGRLLLEAGAIYEDQIAVLQQESTKHGTAGDQIDTALLLDGLEDERQQGITIDVAYRYFTTPHRKFIIADTPGHEQFTRNMATGASTADLAVILVDATKGISTQTKRHAFLVSLLGIQHVVLAVNKMDLVDYQQSCFEQICDDFDRFAGELSIADVCAIPLSALGGDNVVRPSGRMPWYKGEPLLAHLDSVVIGSEGQSQDLRFAVQLVVRPSAEFRGFSGSIASGKMCVGDEVLALPSRKRTRIRNIVTMDGELGEAEASDTVTVVLEDELDIARGDMLVSPHAPPVVGRHAEAIFVWMSEQPLSPGKRYWLKQTTRRTSCEVETIRYGIDVNTLRRGSAASLGLNEIGRCRIVLHDPVMYDGYDRNRTTGSFILVDRITHETAAAGMFVHPGAEPPSDGHWDDHSECVQPQRASSRITDTDRSARHRQSPATILITGLSGSGKTSVAMALEQRLFDAGYNCLVLDGQSLRLGISRDLGFSAEERSENLRRAAEIAKLINDAGQICVAAFVAPSEWVRQKATALIGQERFIHVHLSTPVDVCRRRDITGQYRAADRGEIASFPGVTFEYESPNDADMVVDTEKLSADQVAENITELMKRRSLVW